MSGLMGRAVEKKPVKTHLRKGDPVRVISGKEKGKEGKILQVIRESGKVVIEQLNLIHKHTRPNPKYQKGGILQKEGAIAISNVMLVCRACDAPVRLGAKMMPDGGKLRVCKRCGEVLDKA